MSWSTLLKAGLKYGGKAAKETVKSAGTAVIHPQQTLRGLGTATKAAVVGGTAAYVGWEKLTTDKSVVRIVGDAVVGSDNIDSMSEKVDSIGDKVGSIGDKVSNAVDNVDSKWNGMSNFLKNITSGNGGNMFGNFFSNLVHGNVSGLSIAGLVVSALLVFGRFGWLGKIAGLILGMMMIGNNAGMSQKAEASKEQQKQPEEPDREVVHRSR